MNITGNELFLGNISVECIMQEYGSPLYVYEESVLRSQYKDLSKGFPTDLVEIHYSMKANSNPSLLRILSEEGASIDAVSEFEVLLNEKAQVKMDKALKRVENFAEKQGINP